MADISMLIPKRVRPEWIAGMEEMDVVPMQMVEIPLLGWIAAGQPVDLCENEETVSIPSNMMRRNCYALKVRGHSMIDDNIQDGDVIVVEKCETAANGQSVVAMINGESVTLKKFYVEAGGIRLQPANPDMEPIFLKNEDVQILGIVAGVIRLPENN
ncbi:MAG: repressor LexA [Gammaproteobacteria bacterium]|nr:repressor LexA [Gammaproteobacteria bacterium]